MKKPDSNERGFSQGPYVNKRNFTSRPNAPIFNYDKMIAPTIIKILHAILMLGSVVLGLFAMKLTDSVFLGLVVIIIALILARLFCETLIVIFKINENLQIIVDHYEKEKDNNNY